MILVGTNQKSCIEAFGYKERMLVLEYLGQQDAFRLSVVNGTELAQRATDCMGRMARMCSMAVAMAWQADTEDISLVHNVDTGSREGRSM